ncbi:hypothetical protein C8R46DRAFT_1230763 [Mycena filopes]|nr:hypothetical protein C8R46DRAFT_1230763 [Mycena filopes]
MTASTTSARMGWMGRVELQDQRRARLVAIPPLPVLLSCRLPAPAVVRFKYQPYTELDEDAKRAWDPWNAKSKIVDRSGRQPWHGMRLLGNTAGCDDRWERRFRPSGVTCCILDSCFTRLLHTIILSYAEYEYISASTERGLTSSQTYAWCDPDTVTNILPTVFANPRLPPHYTSAAWRSKSEEMRVRSSERWDGDESTVSSSDNTTWSTEVRPVAPTSTRTRTSTSSNACDGEQPQYRCRRSLEQQQRQLYDESLKCTRSTPPPFQERDRVY